VSHISSEHAPSHPENSFRNCSHNSRIPRQIAVRCAMGTKRNGTIFYVMGTNILYQSHKRTMYDSCLCLRDVSKVRALCICFGKFWINFKEAAKEPEDARPIQEHQEHIQSGEMHRALVSTRCTGNIHGCSLFRFSQYFKRKYSIWAHN
jgi:hypothetical protein